MRIKFTGYLNVDDIDDPEHLDLGHPMGLSEEGHLALVVGETGRSLSLSDLEDVDCELVEDD